jgi:hypothetical protein
VRIEAFVVGEDGSTTGRMKTQCKKVVARNNKNLTDDRFERDGENENVRIFFGIDQMFKIMFNEPAITSPCGLRASNSKLGKVIGNPSQEK